MPLPSIEDIRSSVDRLGFATVEDVLSSSQVNKLLRSLKRISDSTAVRKRGTVFAVRNLLDFSPEIRQLATSIGPFSG